MKISTALLVSCLSSLVLSASAAIELGAPFADGMVLQRGMKVPVWGKATAGNVVCVAFAGQEVSATVGANGTWRVDLEPLIASAESRTIELTEKEPGFLFDTTVGSLEIKDVLVGEVWFCSGQSNTDCPIDGSHPHYRDGQGGTIVQMTMKPNVRLVKNDLIPATKPRDGYRATWRKMTPQTLSRDGKTRLPSAMGYLFALELANSLDIPVGLIDSSWGGTNIDAWTPPEGYANVPSLADVAALPCLSEREFTESKTNGVYKTARNAGVYGGWQQQPSALWNGMVAAYAPMAMRGFIWYQGCHNGWEADRYCDKMHALYDGWSKAFANPDLKLYFVQLAPWNNGFYNLQLAQAKFEREEKNAAMAVINDVGCLTDIHPNDKRTVAKRLALHALKRDYGFDWAVDNSPTLAAHRVENGRFVLSFKDVREWYLYNEDWSLKNGFEVAGADGIWKPAEIENVKNRKEAGKMHGACRGDIDGKDLIVYSPEVKEPVKLRYLYTSPFKGNLYNEVNLPLGAFEIN